jgi:hypothetical protein
VPLAALLIAGDGSGPAILGTPQIEFQLRRARAAGARHAVIFAEKPGAALLASVERLRREGLSVDLARQVSDTAELIHPEEVVLLIAPGVIVAPDRITALANAPGAALLCVRDEPANERFERIDATARWTGFARIDGEMLRRTVAMVGDWDLASTLMRRAVQEGAVRTTLTPDEAGRELIVVDAPLAGQAAGRRLIATADMPPAGWATRWLLAPAARFFAGFASDTGIEARWVTIAGFVLAGLAVLSAFAGWILASLCLLLGALFADLAGDVGSRAGAGGNPYDYLRFPVRAGAATIVVMAMGTTLFMRTLQWGCVVLALVIIGATWLAAPLVRDNPRMAAWRAEPAGHALIGIAGFVLGSPIGALAVAALHSVASLVAAIRAPQNRTDQA